MDFTNLARTSGEWLKGSGPEADIVMSSRIRLGATWRITPSSAGPTRPIAPRSSACCAIGSWGSRIGAADVRGRQQAAGARSAIARRAAVDQPRALRCRRPRGVVIAENEQISLMINEEDHLRIQVIQSGLNLQNAWESINRIDDLVERQVTYAFNENLGYLTACPTNVGTGMRVSVMLHLPALVITRQIDKLFRSLQKISLAVRGLYGEGSQAMGDFYQISNQITLGRAEADLVKQVGDVIPTIIDYERGARLFGAREPRESARSRQPRYGILRHGANDQLGRDHAPAFERAHGGEPGVDQRPRDSHGQQALHLHPARPFAEDHRRRARHGRPQYRAGPLPAPLAQ